MDKEKEILELEKLCEKLRGKKKRHEPIARVKFNAVCEKIELLIKHLKENL